MSSVSRIHLLQRTERHYLIGASKSELKEFERWLAAQVLRGLRHLGWCTPSSAVKRNGRCTNELPHASWKDCWANCGRLREVPREGSRSARPWLRCSHRAVGHMRSAVVGPANGTSQDRYSATSAVGGCLHAPPQRTDQRGARVIVGRCCPAVNTDPRTFHRNNLRQNQLALERNETRSACGGATGTLPAIRIMSWLWREAHARTSEQTRATMQ